MCKNNKQQKPSLEYPQYLLETYNTQVKQFKKRSSSWWETLSTVDPNSQDVVFDAVLDSLDLEQEKHIDCMHVY